MDHFFSCFLITTRLVDGVYGHYRWRAFCLKTPSIGEKIMSSEVIDIFIISIVLLVTLLFVLNKLKNALTKEGGIKCSDCDSQGCSSTKKQDCQTEEVFK